MVRIAYLIAYARELPLYRTPLVDARIYADWASAIAAGDVWSRAEGVFYRAPLYPYLLAGVLTLTGGFQPWISIVQIALGLFVVLGASLLARAAGGERAGVFAGLLVALYGPEIAAESKLLTTTLGLALLTALVLSLHRSCVSTNAARWRLAAGLCWGALALVRPQFLALGFVLPFLLPGTGSTREAGRRDRGRIRSLRPWLGYALGAALVIAPVTLRNRWIGGDWVLVSSNGGMTFFQGNNEENRSGLLSVIERFQVDGSATEQRSLETRAAEREVGRELRPSEVSAFWVRQGIDFIVSQPARWVALELQKLLRFASSYEFADNYSFYIERSRVWPLRLAIVPFGFVLALAVTALVSGPWGRLGARAGTDPPSALAAWRLATATSAFGLLSCLVFYVSSRYRMESLPFLAVLGGVWLGRAFDPGAWKSGRMRAAVVAGIATLALASVPAGAPGRSQESITWLQLGQAFESQGRTAEAEAAFRRAGELLPSNIFAWNTLVLSRSRSADPRTALALLDSLDATSREHPLALYTRGYLLSRLDRTDEAIAAWEAAVRGNPYMREAHRNLGLAYEGKREWGSASEHLDEARRLGDGSPELLSHLGYARLQERSFEAAREAYRARLHVLGGADDGARLDHAVASVYAGRFGEADSLLGLLPATFEPVLASYYRGLVRHARGDPSAAEELERAFERDASLREDFEQLLRDSTFQRR